MEIVDNQIEDVGGYEGEMHTNISSKIIFEWDTTNLISPLSHPIGNRPLIL